MSNGHTPLSQLMCECEQLRRDVEHLREALLLYHEAWNGCERDWHKAMCAASKNAEKLLWPNEQGHARRDNPKT